VKRADDGAKPASIDREARRRSRYEIRMVVYLFFVATLFVPGVLGGVLRHTRAWWVAGLAAALCGVYLLLNLDHTDPGGEGFRAWHDIGNFIQIVYGAFLIAYGAIVSALVCASRRARRNSPPIPPPIPPARVI
jgi:hypothetical protein